MSKLFDLAAPFADAIVKTQQNCYWYGAATTDGDQIVTGTAANPCSCHVPPTIPAAGTNIGWPASDGFALVGRDANQQPLAYTDCSGFTAWLIAQTSPADFEAFVDWSRAHSRHVTPHGQPWPSAAAYAYAGYASLAAGNWSVVVNGTQPPEQWTQRIQPGDLLAWDIQEVKSKVNDTGHVLVLASPLRTASAQQYGVDVIDCSRLLHEADTRKSGVTGVGRGAILLQYSDGRWQYNFGVPGDQFHPAPHISVLRLNV